MFRIKNYRSSVDILIELSGSGRGVGVGVDPDSTFPLFFTKIPPPALFFIAFPNPGFCLPTYINLIASYTYTKNRARSRPGETELVICSLLKTLWAPNPPIQANQGRQVTYLFCSSYSSNLRENGFLKPPRNV